MTLMKPCGSGTEIVSSKGTFTGLCKDGDPLLRYNYLGVYVLLTSGEGNQLCQIDGHAVVVIQSNVLRAEECPVLS